MDASAELIQGCRDMIAEIDKDLSEPEPAWRRIPDDIADDLFEIECDTIRDDIKAQAQLNLDKLSVREVAELVLTRSLDPDAPDPTDEDIDLWIKENLS